MWNTWCSCNMGAARPSRWVRPHGSGQLISEGSGQCWWSPIAGLGWRRGASAGAGGHRAETRRRCLPWCSAPWCPEKRQPAGWCRGQHGVGPRRECLGTTRLRRHRREQREGGDGIGHRGPEESVGWGTVQYYQSRHEHQRVCRRRQRPQCRGTSWWCRHCRWGVQKGGRWGREPCCRRRARRRPMVTGRCTVPARSWALSCGTRHRLGPQSQVAEHWLWWRHCPCALVGRWCGYRRCLLEWYSDVLQVSS